MDISVIGTSNAVIGRNGYLKSLSKRHNVTSFSVGGVPFYMHITEIINNLIFIEEGDLLIVDHLSNPAFVGSYNYEKYLVEFYRLLSSINVHVLVLSFPHKSKVDAFIEHRSKSRVLAKINKITYIDFKDNYVHDSFYKDYQHIELFPSYVFGEWLSDLCSSIEGISKPMNGSFTGFSVAHPPESNGKFRSSLLEKCYCELGPDGIDIRAVGNIISLEFVSNGLCSFSLNGHSFYVSGSKGVFHDSFQEEIVSTGKIYVAKCNFGDDSKSLAPGRTVENKEVKNNLKLVSFLIAGEFHCTPSETRVLFDFDIESLKERLNDYSLMLIKNDS